MPVLGKLLSRQDQEIVGLRCRLTDEAGADAAAAAASDRFGAESVSRGSGTDAFWRGVASAAENRTWSPAGRARRLPLSAASTAAAAAAPGR